MHFLIFVVLVVILYLVWRVYDQLPEIAVKQSDIEEQIRQLRREAGSGDGED